MTIIEQIKAEIERRIKKYATDVTMPLEVLGKVILELKELLSFLSTLESEKPVDLDELEEEYKDYVENDPVYSKLVNRNAGLSIARHFAQWQKEQMMDEWLKDRDGCFWDGVEEGKKTMEEQMLKEAVEVRVQTSPLNGPLGISAYCCNFHSKHPFYHCKEGDKVRIIIIKEDL